MEPLGSLLEPLGGFLKPLGSNLGVSWKLLGSLFSVLEHLRTFLEAWRLQDSQSEVRVIPNHHQGSKQGPWGRVQYGTGYAEGSTLGSIPHQGLGIGVSKQGSTRPEARSLRGSTLYVCATLYILHRIRELFKCNFGCVAIYFFDMHVQVRSKYIFPYSHIYTMYARGRSELLRVSRLEMCSRAPS